MGPMVCELDGPGPILKISKTEVMIGRMVVRLPGLASVGNPVSRLRHVVSHTQGVL
jgi:hypothetical protein